MSVTFDVQIRIAGNNTPCGRRAWADCPEARRSAARPSGHPAPVETLPGSVSIFCHTCHPPAKVLSRRPRSAGPASQPSPRD